jgi:apolipoprotein N-acyltransferase
MLCICFVYGYWRIPNDIGDNNDLSIKVRMIQPNLRTFDFKTNVEKYNSLVKLIELSNYSGYENLDLIVWPEASFPFIMAKHEDLIKSPLQLKYINAKVVFNNNYDIMHFLKFIELDNKIVLMNDISWVAFLQKNIKSKAPLVFGADRYTFSEDQNDYALYNSMFFIYGNEVDFYDKRILVPFGEYVPWKKALPFIHNIVGSAFEFSSGAPSHFAAKAIDSYNIMPLICFESIFDSFYSNMYNKSEIFHSLYSNLLGKNATLILNITNDLWFGDSIGPYHHFTMSLIRSIEYGSSLVRVANSGISAVIDCYGRVLTSCNLNQEVVKDFDVQLHSRKSIYFEYKLMPLVISIITIFFVLNVFLLYKFPNSYKYLI